MARAAVAFATVSPCEFAMLQYGKTCSMKGRDGKTKGIKEIAAANGGFLTASMAGENGVRSRDLADAVRRNDLIRVERGLYCTPDTWEDEYVVAQHRFTRGVFSHDAALYLLGLCDSAPESLTMSFPRGYNPSSAKREGIVAKSSPEGLHDLGLSELTTPYGNAVRAYCAERTLCDMLRGMSSPDLQLLSPAFRSYFSSEGRNLPKLQSFADKLGVAAKVRKYMEVLL